jgi:uncharacterized RDD family membrane protein YckC
MLDSVRRVETPEGVELSLTVAGPAARARAWLIDAIIKAFAWMGIALVMGLFGKAGVGLFLIAAFLIYWMYPVVFEAMHGATPGKMSVGLRVIHDNGTPVGWPAALIRSLIGFVDGLPFGYGVGLLATLVHPDFKRLGDMAAGTVVVHVEKKKRLEGDTTLEPKVAARPPRVPLLLEEQRAVVEFADRAPLLTPERQEELASIAAGITLGDSDRAGQLQAQAAWIAGKR